MSDYLEPVVAAVVGDISDLLAKIAEGQGAMQGFAAEAGAIQFNSPGSAGDLAESAGLAEELAVAEQDAAVSAEELAAAIAGPLAVSDDEIAATIAGTEALNAAIAELATELQVTNAELDQTTASLAAMGATEDEVTGKTKAAGDAAKGAETNWLMWGVAAATVEFGIGAGVLAVSSAVLGAGYLIADFGGEAKGDLQQVENAFRDTASEAAQSYSGATQSITADLVGLAHNVEPEIAGMFQELSGPAESFFSGLETSAEEGIDALVPAIGALTPLISTIAEDIGPIAVGVAGALQEMSQAFEAGGGSQELATLAQEIGQLLPPVGELVGEIGAGLLPVAIALTPVLQTVANVLDALGPGFTTVVAGAYLAYKGWSLLGDASDLLFEKFPALLTAMTAEAAGNTEVAETAGGAAAATEAQAVAAGDTALAATGAAEAVTELAGAEEIETGVALEAAEASEVAGGAMAEEAVEAAAAGLALGDLAAAALPLIAVAGALFLAGDEIVQHWSGVSSFFGQMASDAGQWAEDIGNGFIGGIETVWDDSVGAVEHLGSNLSNAFTSILGINSPSTVFMEHGEDTADGATLGIVAGTPRAVAASSALAQAVASGYGAGLSSFSSSGAGGIGASGSDGSAGAGAGGIVINLTLQVTQPLATPTEIADAVIPAIQGSNLLNGISMASHSGLKGGPGR